MIHIPKKKKDSHRTNGRKAPTVMSPKEATSAIDKKRYHADNNQLRQSHRNRSTATSRTLLPPNITVLHFAPLATGRTEWVFVTFTFSLAATGSALAAHGRARVGHRWKAHSTSTFRTLHAVLVEARMDLAVAVLAREMRVEFVRYCVMALLVRFTFT